MTSEQAKRLAIAYHAYQTAETPNSIYVWGKILLEVQAETGLELATTETLTWRIEWADRQLHKAA